MSTDNCSSTILTDNRSFINNVHRQSFFHQQDDQEKGGVVPDSFPGILRITPNQDGKPLLNEHCSTFGPNGRAEFEHFVKHLLSRVQPKRTNHKRLKGHEPISKCFTPSDEAFALMVLDNKLHVWDQQIEMKQGSSCRKSALRLKKKHTSGHGGNKKNSVDGPSKDEKSTRC